MSSTAWKKRTIVFHTCGVEPKRGSTKRPSMGCTAKSRAAETKSVPEKSRVTGGARPYRGGVRSNVWAMQTSDHADAPRHGLDAVGGAAEVREELHDALYEIKRVIVGQDAMVERVLVALLSGG